MAQVNPKLETFARIKVIGIGGGGCNAVTHMVDSNVNGVDFVAVNTDAQALHSCSAQEKIHIGKNLTKGLGSGMNPEVGRQAAEENRDDLIETVKGSDMVFLTCGMGGGTGTGATPIIAEAAQEADALTVAVVTKPFSFEGNKRKEIAEAGLEQLKSRVDALIVVPNDRLLSLIDRKTSLLSSFEIVDDILRQGVQGISDLITMPGLVNVDFADVRTIMKGTGSALMGIGIASGETRAVDAAKAAINNPMLELSIDGAKGVLFNVTSDTELGMQEINDAAEIINENIDPEAKVIFGTVINEGVINKGEIKITVIATGFTEEEELATYQPSENTYLKTTNSQIVSDVVKSEDNNIAIPVSKPMPVPKKEEPPVKETKVKPSRKPIPIAKPSEPKKADPIPKIVETRLDNDLPIPDEDDLEIPAFIRRKMK